MIVSLMSACGGTSTTALWSPAKPPVVESATDPVEPGTRSLPDGRYWGTLTPSGNAFDLGIARFGATCEEWAATRGMENGCANDYAVEEIDTPPVAFSDDARVSVAALSGPGTNWWIDVATLQAAVAGDITDVPEGWSWTPFPFVVTVENGSVTMAEQHWVP
ncbi:MAG: hypothetical protein ACKOCC_03765 [Actinomycetota bacterium]